MYFIELTLNLKWSSTSVIYCFTRALIILNDESLKIKTCLTKLINHYMRDSITRSFICPLAPSTAGNVQLLIICHDYNYRHAIHRGC